MIEDVVLSELQHKILLSLVRKPKTLVELQREFEGVKDFWVECEVTDLEGYGLIRRLY